ncbi:sigma-70 family RNA polymerase sigma factor [Desulfosporosinus fructosivorans]|uniref:Sigma-70 family RNA polymerase sigma factor n=1 Tax=Desulfosporosinus fructosivorans TaxID=2018669 RepID=A0A4Z0QXP4_9FIRM|nr:sigma-70 family RNA polymerase sigma factor [Desulfosporosinus fructosivorans]TGE34785.1 sigma-70 family RNA polymerase sigma factor [Desulfosporosinus fructosivorans]
MQDIEQLYKVYAKQVYKYLFSLCHSEQMAEELMQETFFRALKSLRTYDGTCKIYVWLCQIAKHIWYQELAKNNRTQITELSSEIPSTENSVEENSILRDGKMSLFKDLHMLAEPMREVMYLRLTGEFSFREIGEILGKDETWARVTFYRGKQKIMKGRVQ